MDDLSAKGWVVYFIIASFLTFLAFLFYRVNSNFVVVPLEILGGYFLMTLVIRLVQWLMDKE